MIHASLRPHTAYSQSQSHLNALFRNYRDLSPELLLHASSPHCRGCPLLSKASHNSNSDTMRTATMLMVLAFIALAGGTALSSAPHAYFRAYCVDLVLHQILRIGLTAVYVSRARPTAHHQPLAAPTDGVVHIVGPSPSAVHGPQLLASRPS
jgi:hypothetical protein